MPAALDGNDIAKFRDFAVQLALKAGAIQMRNYRLVKKVEWTSAQQFRTLTDLEIGRLVREEIEKAFPSHGIYSEEFPPKNEGSDLIWVVDELDGTGNFIRRLTDHFTFCVALVWKLRPVLGVIFAPKRRELYVGGLGEESTLNSKPIRVNDLTDINRVWMGIYSGKHHRDTHVPFIQRAMQTDGVSCLVQSACASMSLALVASGNLDACLATSLGPEDMCAGVAIIEAAGGKVTDIEGREWLFTESSILAANPALHQKLFEFFGIPKPHKEALN